MIEPLECRTVPATITVTSLGDGFNGNGRVSLREAIHAANTDTSVDGSTAGSGADTIVFDSSLFANGPGTVQVTQFDTGLDSGEVGPTAFTISTEMTILGPSVQTVLGTNGVTISRNSPTNFRLFTVTGAGNLTLDTLTIANGAAFGFQGGDGGTGGGGSAGFGGAVYVQPNGALTVRNSLLTGNVAQGGDGGLNGGFSYAGGAGAGLGAPGANGGLDGRQKPLGGGPNSREDYSGYGGGGSGGTSDVVRGFGTPGQTAGDGVMGGFGGGGGGSGIITEGPSTYGMGGSGGFGGGGGGAQQMGMGGRSGYGAGMSMFGKGGGGAGMGGAVFSNRGTVTISNSTLTGNAANGGENRWDKASGFGGAVFVMNGSLTINSSTITGNSVAGSRDSKGRGVMVLGYESGHATATISNSIIAQGDTNQSDIAVTSRGSGGVSASGSGNIIGSGGLGGITVVSSANPMLAPLAYNGGPTRTVALLAGSPALDTGINSNAAGLTFDQRGSGFSRVLNGTVDIGAFEGVYINPPVAQNNTVSVMENVPRAFSVSDFTFTDVQNDPLASIVVTGVTVTAGDTLTANFGNGPVAVTPGMWITAAQIPSIVYTPANGQFGPARGTLQFTVNDTSPTYGLMPGTITINVSMNPGKPTGLALSSTSVNELQPIGFLVGNFQPTSADPNNTFTYSLVRGTGDSSNWLFTTSQDLLLTKAEFDTSYASSFSIRVRVTDKNGFYFEQPFTITVTTGQPTTTYRAYNPRTDAHFFTTNQAEFQSSLNNGYLDETDDDTGFQLLNAPAAGATAVYRLYNLLTGQHYYTTNSVERDMLVTLVPPPASGPDTRVFGWRDEGANGYIFTSQQPGTLPIFRLYNTNSGMHLFTESTAMRDAILSIPGATGQPNPWSLQGVLGYAYPAGFGGQPATPPSSPAATAAAEPVLLPASTAAAGALASTANVDVNVGLLAVPARAVVPPPHAVFAIEASSEADPASSGMMVASPVVDLDLVLRDWTDTLGATVS